MRQQLKRPMDARLQWPSRPSALIQAKMQKAESVHEQGFRPAYARHSLGKIAVEENASDTGSRKHRPSRTGLPEPIKHGVENLSGIPLDDVRVHYRSPKPSGVQALAYTQGTDIYVAPGQEKHLAHEAWHVVQQQQGCVHGTTQVSGIAMNDDSSLEREADSMGAIAARGSAHPRQQPLANNSLPAATSTAPIQAMAGARETTAGEYKTLEAFKADVAALSSVYGELEPAAIENAFKVYQHALRTQLDLAIVGRLVEQSNEAAPGIDAPLRENFLRMNEGAQGGSVLNSEKWTMLMNDAWLLAGLHSRNPFYLASGRTAENVKGTNPDFPMTVTGRELIGITSSGYEVVAGHPALGEVARPINKDAAKNATLRTYAEAVKNAVAEGRLKPEILEHLTAAAKPVSKR